MEISEEMWKAFQEHLNYTDEEMHKFRANPRNADVLAKVRTLLGKRIVVEVVGSHGCNSRHLVGDKFNFDGAGNLITKLGPKRICVYALSSIAPLIFTANELIYAGVDPNEMRFKRTGCFDVGVQCGGWGRVVMELRVEKNTKEE